MSVDDSSHLYDSQEKKPNQKCKIRLANKLTTHREIGDPEIQ